MDAKMIKHAGAVLVIEKVFLVGGKGVILDVHAEDSNVDSGLDWQRDGVDAGGVVWIVVGVFW